MKHALIALAAGMLVQQAEEKDWHEYFPAKEGRTWTYAARRNGATADVTMKVTGKAKVNNHDCLVVKWEKLDPSTTKEKPVKSADIISLRVVPEGVRMEAIEKRPPIEPQEAFLMRFPLKKGTTWLNIFTAPGMIEVGEKTEEIKVPAGTYTCKVLAFSSKYPDMTFHTKWYLARGVGFVKIEHATEKDGKTEVDDVSELKAMTK